MEKGDAPGQIPSHAARLMHWWGATDSSSAPNEASPHLFNGLCDPSRSRAVQEARCEGGFCAVIRVGREDQSGIWERKTQSLYVAAEVERATSQTDGSKYTRSQGAPPSVPRQRE